MFILYSLCKCLHWNYKHLILNICSHQQESSTWLTELRIEEWNISCLKYNNKMKIKIFFLFQTMRVSLHIFLKASSGGIKKVAHSVVVRSKLLYHFTWKGQVKQRLKRLMGSILTLKEGNLSENSNLSLKGRLDWNYQKPLFF